MKAERAYRLVRTAIKQQRLIRPLHCENCNAPDTKQTSGRHTIQAHHYCGYDNPFLVKWLCAACHRKETPLPPAEKNGGRLNPSRGSKNGQSRLTDDLVRYIKQSSDSGRKLAREIGVDKGTIYRVRNGTQWRHIQ